MKNVSTQTSRGKGEKAFERENLRLSLFSVKKAYVKLKPETLAVDITTALGLA